MEADNGRHFRFCHPQRGSAPDAVQYEFSAKEYEYDLSRPGRKEVAHNLGRRLALSAQLDHYCYQSEGLALT